MYDTLFLVCPSKKTHALRGLFSKNKVLEPYQLAFKYKRKATSYQWLFSGDNSLIMP